jgi:hypothetical protein
MFERSLFFRMKHFLCVKITNMATVQSFEVLCGNLIQSALGYGLDDRGSAVRFPAGAGNFSLNHRF